MTKQTSSLFPAPPRATEPLKATRPSSEVREFLATRRSAPKQMLRAPGPNAEQLDHLLYVAARVPDHRKLGPWRFIVFENETREAFGEKIVDIFKTQNPDATEKQIEDERNRFHRAPTIVTVVSSPVDDGRTPIWEQELSAGAVCYNLLLAANASGWAGSWLTEWLAFDTEIASAMGLSSHERIAGIIYLGTTHVDPPERPRPDVHERTTRWSP